MSVDRLLYEIATNLSEMLSQAEYMSKEHSADRVHFKMAASQIVWWVNQRSAHPSPHGEHVPREFRHGKNGHSVVHPTICGRHREFEEFQTKSNFWSKSIGDGFAFPGSRSMKQGPPIED